MHKLTQNLFIAEDYRPEFYEDLIPFEVAKKKLRHRYNMIARLGDILCAYDVQKFLGVCLLRKHFELRPHEQLIKRAITNKNQATLCAQQAKQDTQAYLWRLYEHHGKLAYIPTEAFAASEPLAHKLPTFAQLTKQHPGFFIDFAQISMELQTSHIFGLSILHPGLVRLEEGQTQLETVDHDTRERHIGAIALAELDPFEVTETLWTFGPAQSVRCKSYCED